MNKVTPQMFMRVFQANPEGELVFQYLCTMFYDIQSYTRNDPYHTAYLEGCREVMAFIINNINKAEKGEQHGEISEEG